jgi:hypothetical protein
MTESGTRRAVREEWVAPGSEKLTPCGVPWKVEDPGFRRVGPCSLLRRTTLPPTPRMR